MLDRGEDATKAKQLLDEALAGQDLTPEERRQALLALSRAHEALGNQEQAIALLENEIAANADRRDWSGEAFNKRLRKLLGHEEVKPTMSHRRDEPVAAFAHVLAPYFPTSADGKVDAEMFMIGAESQHSDELGTYNIGGALREQQEKECPLCETKVNVHTHIGRSNWLMIPAQQQKFGGALTVFYFNLNEDRVPSRYEHHMPMKVDEIVRELEAGKSFVVAKERPGAPPSLLIAAPRRAMLAEVEDKLATLTELPTEPLYVDVPVELRREEIQGTIRAQWFPHARACYEAALKRGTIEGAVSMNFAISAEGVPSKSEAKVTKGNLDEQPFLDCMLDALDTVRFPAGGKTVTIHYPVVFTKD
jgi:tetratricopeptide (TPR) repeat protein